MPQAEKTTSGLGWRQDVFHESMYSSSTTTKAPLRPPIIPFVATHVSAQLDLSTVTNHSPSLPPSLRRSQNTSHSNPIVTSPCTFAVKCSSTSKSNSIRIFKLLSFCFGLPLSSRSAPARSAFLMSAGLIALISSSDILAISLSCLRLPRGVVAGSSRRELCSCLLVRGHG